MRTMKLPLLFADFYREYNDANDGDEDEDYGNDVDVDGDNNCK